jgi:hypothetical protein
LDVRTIEIRAFKIRIFDDLVLHDSLSLRRGAAVHAPIVHALAKTSSVVLTQSSLFFLSRIRMRVSADPDLLIAPIAAPCDHSCDHLSPASRPSGLHNPLRRFPRFPWLPLCNLKCNLLSLNSEGLIKKEARDLRARVFIRTRV